MWVAALRLDWASWTVFLLLATAFYLLGPGSSSASTDWTPTTATSGALTRFAAACVRFAEVANRATTSCRSTGLPLPARAAPPSRRPTGGVGRRSPQRPTLFQRVDPTVEFDMYRIGILGCGWAGERHYRAVEGSERGRVVAVTDTDPTVRERRSEEWRVTAYADTFTLLDEADPDAVIVALPHDEHEDAAVAAAEAGVDVLCEKPVAPNLAAADRMVDAADEAGAALCVAETARYEPAPRVVESLLADRATGRPTFGSYNWLHGHEEYRYPDREWLTDPGRADGGRWLTNGVRPVSVLRGWWAAADAGDVTRVAASAVRGESSDAESGVVENVGVQLQFEDGSTATVNLGLEVPHCERFNEARIHGTEGTVVLPHGRSKVERYDAAGNCEPTMVADDSDPLVAQTTHFLDLLDGECSPRTSGLRERNTLAVVEAGYEAMETGRTVAVDRRERL
jgi:predicted dehydrogenase